MAKAKPSSKRGRTAGTPKRKAGAIPMPSRATRHPKPVSLGDMVPGVDNPCAGYIPLPPKPRTPGEYWPKVKIGADGEVESVTFVPV